MRTTKEKNLGKRNEMQVKFKPLANSKVSGEEWWL
jgi:hypothetical protein